ncbi:hypothetical protein PICST_55556, partial [Scheffersomyces stipitis CBS 6054]
AENYLSIPIDTYPNPLYSMSKEKLLKLTAPEFKHLTSISHRTKEEQDQYCHNIIEITFETILEDPEKVARLLNSIKDTETKSILVATLSKAFCNDNIQLSILNYIVDPTSKKFRTGFFKVLTNILHLKGKTTEERGVILLSYLRLLSLTNIINAEPLILTTNVYSKIINSIPPSKFSELYSYLFHVNIQTTLLETLKVLRKTLLRGTQSDRFVARTGWINPKWHDLLTTSFSEIHQKKMINFFSIDDLREITDISVREKDTPTASLYLNLLVAKFEQKCASQTPLRLDDSNSLDDVQIVIRVIVNYLMAFKGAKSCLQVLKYCIKNKLEIEFPLLLVIMRNLRLSGHFKEALLLINNIPLQNLSYQDRSSLVQEVLMLIKSRYPGTPNVLIGYTAAMLGGSVAGENSGLKLLNKLHLLELTYGSGALGEMASFESIQEASIDDKLTGFEFTSNTLANVYETILDSYDRADLTPNFINSLYDIYIKEVLKSLANETPIQPFTAESMNDRVVNHLISYLLRTSPGGRANFKIDSNLERYEVAKRIFTDFIANVELSRKDITVSLIDLLVHTSLEVHSDYNFASKVVRYSRERHLPFTFNQIYPFIIHHYNKNEYKVAELWYKQLTNSGAKTTAPPAKNLFRIARELNWDVNGFAYRRKNIEKNYKKREELAKIHADPIVFLGENDTEDAITEELVNGIHAEKSDSNFSEELSALLYSSEL